MRDHLREKDWEKAPKEMASDKIDFILKLTRSNKEETSF